MNSFASVGVADDFARVIDNYQYSLTVDWDQKDQAQHKKITDQFYQDLDLLTKGDGLKMQEIEEVLAAKVKNTKSLESVSAKIALMGKNASREELLRFLDAEVKNMYSVGSSWNGETTVTIGVGVLLIALLAYSFWFSANHTCVEQAREEWSCTTERYQDPYSLRWIDGQSCSYQPVCTKYERN